MKAKNKPLNILEVVTLVKDIFSILAAICVGIWAVYNLLILNEERIAGLKVKELTQKTELKPQISSSMELTYHSLAEGEYAIQIRIKISNNGSEFSRLNLEKESLSISKVSFDKELPEFSETAYIGDAKFSGWPKVVLPFLDVGANEEYTLNYITKVVGSGIYMIRFLSKKTDESINKHKIKTNTPRFVNFAVGSDEYLVIK